MAQPTQAAEHVDLLIRSATVVDVRSGTLDAERSIVIRGDDIVAIGDAAIAGRYRAARTVDARGRFVIPGLWDMHVHFGGGEALIAENRALLPLYVAHGVTTVRDAAADIAPSVLEWRDAVARGAMFGPTIFTSGPKLEGYKPTWKGTIEVGTPAEVDAALDRLRRMRVDFVKITDNTLAPDIFLYAVEEATRRGFRTSAHVPMALTIEQVTAAGLSSIEHLGYALKAGSTDEVAIAADYAAGRLSEPEASQRLAASFDREHAMAAYRKLAERGTFVTPTLNGSRIIDYLDREDHSRDAFLEYIGPGLRATYGWRVERAARDDAAAIERRHRRYQQVASVLPMLQAAGVTILAGTDAGYLNSFNYPGIGLHDELGLYVVVRAHAAAGSAIGDARGTGVLPADESLRDDRGRQGRGPAAPRCQPHRGHRGDPRDTRGGHQGQLSRPARARRAAARGAAVSRRSDALAVTRGPWS